MLQPPFWQEAVAACVVLVAIQLYFFVCFVSVFCDLDNVLQLFVNLLGLCPFDVSILCKIWSAGCYHKCNTTFGVAAAAFTLWIHLRMWIVFMVTIQLIFCLKFDCSIC